MLCAVGGAFAAFGAQWTELTFQHPSAPQLDFLQSMQNWAWIPGTLALILIVPVARPRRPAAAGSVSVFVALGAVVTVAMVIFRWTNPFPWPDGDPIMPLAIESEDVARPASTDIDRAFMAAIVVLGLIAAGDVARRWRDVDRSSDDAASDGWRSARS